ncbi:unnamed protein product [Linum grandiflorum]
MLPTLTLLLLLLLPLFLSAARPDSPSEEEPKYHTDAAVAAGPPIPILDIDGKAVRAGTSYYIIPATSSPASDCGGVRMATSSNDSSTSCPLSVVQDPHEDSSGTPLMFLPVATKTGYMVRTSTDLNIEFTADDTAICDEGNVWKVDDYDDDVEQWFVGTGGVEGKPGPRTVNNWFKIVKYGGGGGSYKLAYCPGVCKSCKIKCKDVGLFVDEDGNRRLALVEDHAFVVSFMRAD